MHSCTLGKTMGEVHIQMVQFCYARVHLDISHTMRNLTMHSSTFGKTVGGGDFRLVKFRNALVHLDNKTRKNEAILESHFHRLVAT